MSIDQALMRLAYDMAFNKTLSSFCIWWADKYNKPLFHDSLKEYLEEELVIEWFIARLLKDKKFKTQCEHGILNIEEMDEEWLKKEMGEAYKSPSWNSPEEAAKGVMESIKTNEGTIHDDYTKNNS